MIKFSQEETDNLNSSTSIKKTEIALKKIPTNKNSD